ncbi:hypothetical protein [Herpetosiphon geysericola]|uniref:Uncharacterized protein n=1 Tax=Herpetosiphon geysericola TaxID=70996 RepID=A0A0P6XWY6_9CHLR|nr:hypothetical protein [Herpetosiphon geysericola]KPL80211.1 hypothetical protein SE18_24450 [Herpetosiphon geysericola]
MYLLITTYGSEKMIERAATLDEVMRFYRDSSASPGDLIVAKELILTFVEPADPVECPHDGQDGKPVCGDCGQLLH